MDKTHKGGNISHWESLEVHFRDYQRMQELIYLHIWIWPWTADVPAFMSRVLVLQVCHQPDLCIPGDWPLDKASILPTEPYPWPQILAFKYTLWIFSPPMTYKLIQYCVGCCVFGAGERAHMWLRCRSQRPTVRSHSCLPSYWGSICLVSDAVLYTAG